MFAKPFVDAFEGHQDGVYCLGKDPRRVSVVAAGGGDGEVIVHSLTLRRPLLKVPNAHKGMVGGVCWTAEARDGKRGLVTCGKIWRSDAFAPGVRDKEVFKGSEFGEGFGSTSQAMLDTAGAVGESGIEFDEEEGGGLMIDSSKRDALGRSIDPVMTYTSKNAFNSIDHHRTEAVFATASNTVQIWDENRSSPLSTLAFASSLETVAGVRFNQSETSVLASVGNDRTLCLYDIRTGKAERRIIMQVRICTCLCPYGEMLNEGCSSARTACHGPRPYRQSCYWGPRTITCIRLTSGISITRRRSTRVMLEPSWAAIGVS